MQIALGFPNEYIVSVSGYVGPSSRLATKTSVVRSLTFKTNTGQVFGPYGVSDGTPFELPVGNGKIAGFNGSTGQVLNAIGINLAI